MITPVDGVLVTADALAVALAGTDASDPARPVLLDVRWTLGGPSGRPEHEAGHVPGARFVDLETELSAPHPAEATRARPGGRHPLPAPADFQAAMRRAGVSGGRPVVVYDGSNALAAARLWWLLTDAGHSDVTVLDGGWAAWRDGGHPVETGPAGPAGPVVEGDFVARPGHRRFWDADRLAAAIAAGTAPAVADVRGWERYTGESEPVDPVAGHLPGAVSAPSMDNVGPDGRFRPAAEIAARYADLDAAAGPDGPVFYCGSGITAAHTLLAREAAGLTAGAIYPGSWSDWISDPDRPRATGDGPRV
ncbi:thiosulfate/3-mercaptopyruvate sulfurtransferase [Friedmanniella endophytica]|uniref:Thiosulfate/3-mercaptopyruvate sulfurtransferase n=1 Tax=Microlunatus kandeliicorticis TaxID=1759536 RepID=A0A7W3P6U6_9ACTN|nr:sulfurtransferase [Microlunatus kandeliicorticis]MBA8795344.1 thiosulfate/3-mercaptopyruvate sulfurtransferase [Microlunatus kandeliicorticis]